MVVAVSNGKRLQGLVTRKLSKSRFQVRLDDNRLIIRHLNHIWKGGGTHPGRVIPDPDDYVFYSGDPVRDVNAQGSSPRDPTPQLRNEAVPQAPLEETSDTPRRPSRPKVQPKRLVLDPHAKAYTEW